MSRALLFTVFCLIPGALPGVINGTEFAIDRTFDGPPGEQRLVAVDVPKETAEHFALVPGFTATPQDGSAPVAPTLADSGSVAADRSAAAADRAEAAKDRAAAALDRKVAEQARADAAEHRKAADKALDASTKAHAKPAGKAAAT